MGKFNWAGIILLIVIILSLLTFLASKITIYDGTQITGLPNQQSVLTAIGNALADWIKSWFGL